MQRAKNGIKNGQWEKERTLVKIGEMADLSSFEDQTI